MTDKEQIIIDGVDVRGCVQFTQEEEDCCNLGGGCKGWPNCYFKQLARKTQGYNELLEQYKELDDRANRLIEEKYRLARECEQKDERIIELTKEYQRLKEQKDKADKTISDLIGCVSLWEEFTEEESKLAKDSSIADLIMLLRKKTQECEKLKNNLHIANTNHEAAEQECDRYRKALEEIEETITALHYIAIPFHKGITHELADIVQEYKNKILNIINKAKGESV